jgi:curved DNA-binding protein CbpA
MLLAVLAFYFLLLTSLMPNKNYYKILNVDYTATTVEIKKAYRKLAHLHHPDKAKSETAKAKFDDIKEAYEVLVDAAKRKEYNLTFDNFSYKKETFLTPYNVLQKAKAMHGKLETQDPHRLNLDKLEFQILELLSERNINTLQSTPEKDIVHKIVEELLEMAKPLTASQFKNISQELKKITTAEDEEKINTALESHKWQSRWSTYKIVVASIAGILLCIIIYLVSNKK